MVRGVLLSCVVVLLVGCESLPGAQAAAVHIDVSYDFNAGCIAVVARDGAAPEKEDREQKEVLGRMPAAGTQRQADFAVYRGEDWSPTLAIVITAHEQACDGPEVARQEVEYTLTEAGRHWLPVTLTAPDADGDGWVALSANGRDCDDTHAGSHPAVTSETCDGRDNDCRNGIDDGLPKTGFFRDGDGDGVGAGPAVSACKAPPGHVTTNGDCADGDSAVKPGAAERCNGEDDDCDNSKDEDFPQKNTACTKNSCSGTLVCKADQTGTECNAPAPVAFYPDADGDQEGDGSATAQQACPGSPPSGRVSNNTDCDDRDPHNRSAGPEVCDDRDNNCSMGKDEGNICGGKGWKVLTDPVTTSRTWTTVAVRGAGGDVWIAGETGALAVRPAGATSFNDHHQACGTHNWRAAWVHPGDGRVFLAGDGGHLAVFDRTACTNVNTANATGGTTATRALLDITGFTSGSTTTLYAVSDFGHVFAWAPGNMPAFRSKRSEDSPYRGIHGTAASQLLIVGHDANDALEIQGFDGTNRATHTWSGVPSANSGSLFGVWAWSTTGAYAVGQKGNLLRRAGGTTWAFASPDASLQVNLNSVVAFDDASVYIASQDGWIRRPGRGEWIQHFNAGAPLRDIAAASREDIWAVGNGLVVHFPEPLSAP